MTVTALVIRRDDPDSAVRVAVEQFDDVQLPDDEVMIDVERSSINYKDALVIAGRPGFVREFPHVPGIDLAGTVATSTVPEFGPGDRVLVTGCSLGERHWGGLATRARVPASWVVRRPSSMDAQRAMALGTAGFTAQLALDVIVDGGVRPDDGPILVTGATGGVGTIAVMILAAAGYEVDASTGSSADPAAQDLLRKIGATRILPREDVSSAAGRALASGRWAGAIDVAGGDTLAGALAQTLPRGIVVACGLADAAALTTTVMPFIIRGVSLTGIDSALFPVPDRDAVWERLHASVAAKSLDLLTTTVGLNEVAARAMTLLEQGVRGRTVVNPNI